MVTVQDPDNWRMYERCYNDCQSGHTLYASVLHSTVHSPPVTLVTSSMLHQRHEETDVFNLVCECFLLVFFLTEKSICGNVLYHIIFAFRLSAIKIMLRSFMNVSHQWRWRSLSHLVLTFECCRKKYFPMIPFRCCCCEVTVTESTS